MFYTKRPRQFNYKPRYYDAEKERSEELKRLVGEVQASDEERIVRMQQAFARKHPLKKKRKGLLQGRRFIMYIVLVGLLIIIISQSNWLIR
ncbi:hypothetical protein FACS1894201_10050 [Bacteroidia bacterium]|nr:hypothetical protein FACS1894201_10050 [Bacteroidia bacterium]